MKMQQGRRLFAVMTALTVMLTAGMVGQAQAASFKITSAVLAKKYSGGKTSGVTNRFKASDRTIYCVVKTNKILTNTKVRFLWTALKAKGIRANEKFLDKTSNIKKADIFWGSAALARNWPTGSYKVDVYIGGSKVKTLTYSIS